MLKLLALCTILSFVYSEEQNEKEIEIVEVSIINYAAMYNNECSKSSTTAAPSSDKSDKSDDDENGYEYKYDKYYKKYEEKYADKYENKYSGSSNPGSVKGNEIGGDDGGNSENQETSTFCKCLKKVEKTGKSYADSQNDFSKCIDKANGNDAKHWEKVAKRYEKKYGVKTNSWDLPSITTTPVPSKKGNDNNDKEEDKEEVKDWFAVSTTIYVDNVNNDNDKEKVMMFDDNNNNDDIITNNDRFGKAAIYLTFIGTSILLFICAWFIKDGMKKWKLREYQHVKQMNNSSFESEADADSNGNPYGGNYDDWDDNYDQNYLENNSSEKKGKFAGWNQYAAV